ncbi:MAG: hypothetical protein U9R00_02950 [Patescibacteria group bacterium]|nr:hypothetical protein [Patescibacteria group bacterium]
MSNILKILIPATISFLSGLFLTPVLTHYFYKYKMWKKTARSKNTSDNFKKICNDAETSTPRTGGMIIWLSVSITIFIILFLDLIIPSDITQKLNFISRNQTLLPLFTLILASLIGLGDDFIQIFNKNKWTKDSIKLRYIKAGIILILGIVIGSWFYFKLGITELYIPWYGFINLGSLFIPFFIIVMLGIFSSSVIDGIDGLAGGILASIFASYTLIAFLNNQIDIATLSAVITGGILAFLWFNIPPARFYMGETGMIGLTVTLAVLAFMTNTVLLLPVIAFPLIATSLSNIIQMTAKKFNRKVFKFAPFHHHLEAIGWSRYKIVMRYWIVGTITAIIGIILSLIS